MNHEREPKAEEFYAQVDAFLDSHKTLSGKRKTRFRMGESEEISLQLLDLWITSSGPYNVTLLDFIFKIPRQWGGEVFARIVDMELSGDNIREYVLRKISQPHLSNFPNQIQRTGDENNAISL